MVLVFFFSFAVWLLIVDSKSSRERTTEQRIYTDREKPKSYYRAANAVHHSSRKRELVLFVGIKHVLRIRLQISRRAAIQHTDLLTFQYENRA